MTAARVFNPCLVVPFYRHERALGGTLDSLRSLKLPCWLVDDGSGSSCTVLLDELERRESSWLRVIRYQPNQGKGQAVMTGCAAALSAGHTHAVQIDADGQHDATAVPRLLELARAHPQALVTGLPQYDASVPKARLYGRYVTHVWVWINTLSLEISDSMCGFRVYPLAPALEVWNTQTVGRRMDFDTEIMVRMHWQGTPVLGLPVRVVYPADGVSHFDVLRDNLRISRMHARLFFGMLWRLPRLIARKFHKSSLQAGA